ncbi:hypothetical protein CHS0354_002108 [Potamilus streckersoni]|uniref:Death domain-containing protein n=1 Tax=Potamilus streckersoni TaxID=2493646 RepID=A0AAE0TIV4_9BIVA|nr:hypothetical protein CHS0354_002108 [Potamilus streckersoni]
MSWKIPCNATEGRFYNGGKVCSKCDICPGGQGRDMSKRVLNTSETHGDLECIKCEVCPPKTYNNGGREGCKKCLDDCALRNRHDCPEKATRLCGECLDGYFEDYQIDDNPSTCIPCTEKEKSIIPACANLTTHAASAINTTHLSSKATTYLRRFKRGITYDDYVFKENIPVQHKAVESNNEKAPTEHSYVFPTLLALGTITTVLVVFLTIWVICGCYKKRRQKQSCTDQENVTGVLSDGPLLGGSNRNKGNAHNDDLTTDIDMETDANAVPKGMDRNRWIHRQELLKSNISIQQLCAKRWIALDSEYPVLSMLNEEVELLKKEAQSKIWTPQELNFQILSRWAQIRGNQATVQALCDALFTKKHYDIIEDIMIIHEMKLN